MTPKAREALEASIEHWRKNVEAKTPEDASISGPDCALCNAYGNREDCRGCPVARAAEPGCHSSPYYEARRAFFVWRNLGGAREEWCAAAQKELKFLESLREEDRR